MDMAQEEAQLPLVLLVAARRAEGERGPAFVECQRRRKRRARAFAGRQARWAGPASARTSARASSGRSRGPGTVGDDCSQPPEGVAEIMLPCRSMTSIWTVSPRFCGEMRHGRLVDGACRPIGGVASIRIVRVELRLEARHPAGLQVDRSLSDRSACGAPRRSASDKQVLDRHVAEIRVAVVDLAIGEGELHGLRHDVRRIQRRLDPSPPMSKPFRIASDLQKGRPLSPWAGLGDRPAMVIVGQRRLDVRRPCCHVVGGQHAVVPRRRWRPSPRPCAR